MVTHCISSKVNSEGLKYLCGAGLCGLGLIAKSDLAKGEYVA